MCTEAERLIHAALDTRNCCGEVGVPCPARALNEQVDGVVLLWTFQQFSGFRGTVKEGMRVGGRARTWHVVRNPSVPKS